MPLYDKNYKIFSENLKRTLGISRRKWKNIKLKSDTDGCNNECWIHLVQERILGTP
jgi:hypothetical protein